MADVSGTATPTLEPAPPAGPPARPMGGPSGPRAGFWRRCGALFVDFIVLSVVDGVLIAALRPSIVTYYALAWAVAWAYYISLEGGRRGQTVGKMALGIRIIDFRAGGPIGYGRAFVRQLVKIFSGAAILLGYLWMLWDDERQTWHDKAARDVVVPVTAYPVD